MYILQMPTNSLAGTFDVNNDRGRGYTSILMKSLSFRDDQFMDLLMEITMVSENATLSWFIGNLDALS